MLDRAALAALHLAKQLADAPERLGLLDALADGGVEHETFLHAGGQDLLHRLAQALAPLRRQLDQHRIGRRLRQRIAGAAVLDDDVDALARHDLEARYAAGSELGGET